MRTQAPPARSMTATGDGAKLGGSMTKANSGLWPDGVMQGNAGFRIVYCAWLAARDPGRLGTYVYRQEGKRRPERGRGLSTRTAVMHPKYAPRCTPYDSRQCYSASRPSPPVVGLSSRRITDLGSRLRRRRIFMQCRAQVRSSLRSGGGVTLLPGQFARKGAVLRRACWH